MSFHSRKSQDISQRKIDQTYENCQGAVGIVDDVHVFGNDSTHDLHVYKAKAVIKFNSDKCIIKSNPVASVEIYTLTPQGVKPDPK